MQSSKGSFVRIWYSYRTQIRSKPCCVSPSVSQCSCWILLKLDLSKLLLGFPFKFIDGFVKIEIWIFWVVKWMCQNWHMDFSKLLHWFVKIDTWMSLIFYMNLSKFLHGFVKVVTWICQICFMYYSHLAKKTKLKFNQDFKACWSFFQFP